MMLRPLLELPLGVDAPGSIVITALQLLSQLYPSIFLWARSSLKAAEGD